MRLCSLLLLMPQLLLATAESNLAILFGTSDFALITQQNCARLIERDLESGQCPFGLSYAENLETIDRSCLHVIPESVRSHLIRDVHRKTKPRILYVYTTKVTGGVHQVNYNIEDLSLDKVKNNQFIVPTALKVHTKPGYLLQQYEELVDTIFDTQSNILYVITKQFNDERLVHVIYISDIFNVKTNNHYTKFAIFKIHQNATNKFDFVENPYEHTVYYKHSNNSHIIVSKLPISELMQCLNDGREGEPVSAIQDPLRTLIWAHNEAIISTLRTTVETNMDVYYLKNVTDAAGKTCPFPETKPVNNKKSLRRLITLFDWDYCVLAYHGDGTKKPDGTQCPIYYNDLAINNSGSSGTIYIIAIVLLAMMLMVLAVYICYLKRNFEETYPRDDHKPVPYYPSGQPLDSTFDMSVDRWDQY